MKNLMIIEDDKVFHVGDSQGKKLDELFHKFLHMKSELKDYLIYKHAYEESGKSSTDIRNMMLDELKHYKHAHTEFFKCLKENALIDEEKAIINSIPESIK